MVLYPLLTNKAGTGFWVLAIFQDRARSGLIEKEQLNLSIAEPL